MLEAIYNKWKSKTVTGEQPSKQQQIIGFINSVKALEMLKKHLDRGSLIAIHCDVDLDGIGSGYIARRFISCNSQTSPICVINQGKKHGIEQKHCDFFNKTPVGLMLIVDSSSNELEYIKQFNCDVLVVDHHEVDHNEFSGFTNDGKHEFIIVNNTIDNFDNDFTNKWLKSNNQNTNVIIEDYKADYEMSCGVVLYELLRLFQEAYKVGSLLENMLLYQWAGVTLFTDAIPMLNERNQWYIDNTVHSRFVEPTLGIMLNELNKFSVTLDKSFINYKLAPTFNKAIRANANAEALTIVMERPYNVKYLERYKEQQELAINEALNIAEIKENYSLVNITNTEINPNYTGVIAGRILDDSKKNTVAFVVNNGIAEGSFRGRSSNVDYRRSFNSYFEDNRIIAQGHKQAFGFKVEYKYLEEIMTRLIELEGDVTFDKAYLTAGNLPDSLKGQYHIDDIDAFKKQGGLMMIAIGNSKVASDEQILITVHSSEAKLIEQHGKLYYYDVLGLTCKAFEEIKVGMINIYPEYSKSIEFYIK